MDNKVVSFAELKEMTKGEICPIPSFVGRDPMYVRLKKVGLLNLISKGSINNSLLSAAEELFTGKQGSKGQVDMKQLTQVMKNVAELSLIEPSMKQLEELGLEFSDEQIVAIFNYNQAGISALEPSNKGSENLIDNINESKL